MLPLACRSKAEDASGAAKFNLAASDHRMLHIATWFLSGVACQKLHAVAGFGSCTVSSILFSIIT